jgi:hypothetical protein
MDITPTTDAIAMTTTTKRFYDHTQPEEMAKCRERQKLYYERRNSNLITCKACNKAYNEFNIYSHFKTKKHQKNDPKGLNFNY